MFIIYRPVEYSNTFHHSLRFHGRTIIIEGGGGGGEQLFPNLLMLISWIQWNATVIENVHSYRFRFEEEYRWKITYM